MNRRRFLGLLGATALTPIVPIDPVHPELRAMATRIRTLPMSTVQPVSGYTAQLIESMMETQLNYTARVLNETFDKHMPSILDSWRIIEHDGKDVTMRFISDEEMRA